jgi:uncharacterized protein
MNNMQYRAIENVPQLREQEGEVPRLEGYAMVWDSLGDLGGYKERIKRESVSTTLNDQHNIFAYYSHDSKIPLARTDNGSLVLVADDHGLHYSFALDETTDARNLYIRCKSGLIRGCSFGFLPTKINQVREGKTDIDEVVEMTLYEVSPTANPVYTETECKARSQDADKYIDYFEQEFRQIIAEMTI